MFTKIRSIRTGWLWVAAVLLLAACQPAPTPSAAETGQPARLKVLATTNIVGDVVAQVGGDAIELSILIPQGVDEHAFEPSPQDIARVANADLVVISGAGLETFIDPLIENAGGKARLVDASHGITLKDFGAAHGHEHEGEEEHEDEHENEHEGEDHHEHTEGDPHVWIDPNNVLVWTHNIADALGEQDEANAQTYRANAGQYEQKLKELDAWIRQQVEQISPADRKIVTDHLLFGYFAERYGFEQVGAIIPNYSTLAQPSAQELAALEDAIRDLGVKAIFVGNTVNPTLAQRVADDTGVKLVFIYTGSLSEAGGPAENYLDYIRYNVNAIVEALK